MTAKERTLTKRLADLEERVRHLEAEPREIHHHYPAPQPIYVRPAYPYPYQPYTPWWGTLTCGTPYNGTINSSGFSQIVDNSPSGVLTTICPDGDQFSYTTNGVQS